MVGVLSPPQSAEMVKQVMTINLTIIKHIQNNIEDNISVLKQTSRTMTHLKNSRSTVSHSLLHDEWSNPIFTNQASRAAATRRYCQNRRRSASTGGVADGYIRNTRGGRAAPPTSRRDVTGLRTLPTRHRTPVSPSPRSYVVAKFRRTFLLKTLKTRNYFIVLKTF